MGSGRWTPDTYYTRAAANAAAGRDPFDYSRAAIASGRLKPHQTLDPQGLGVRQSRDSADHPTSNAVLTRQLFGGALRENVPLRQLVAEATERWHVYFVIPGGAAYGHSPAILQFWADLLGDGHVIALQSPDQTSECIALTIGVNEGTVDVPTALVQMKARGVVGQAVDAIAHVLHGLFGGGPPPARHL